MTAVLVREEIAEAGIRLLRERVFDVDLEALAQQLDACLGDRLADQDALRHTRVRSS